MTNKTVSFLVSFIVIFKIAAVYFTEFDLYGDEAQYWLWSTSLDLGYFSKPPLLAWFLFGHTSLFGDTFFSLKMFPLIMYFFISLAIYQLCLCLRFSKNSSSFCALSFLIIPSASLSSFLISTDLLLLLFWTMSMSKLLEIRSNGSILNFFLLGLFLGCAFLAKYAAVYFLVSFLFLIIMDKKILGVFKNNAGGFVFFILSLLLVLLPNIYWNLNNGWVTLFHTSSNANLENLNLNTYEPFLFLTTQILMVGPVLFLSFIFLIKYFSLDFENKFLLVFSIPTIVIVLIESFLVRANANWAAPALISVFVLFFRLINEKNTLLIKLNFLFNYVVAIFLFGAILNSSNHQMFDRIRGVSGFVSEISEIINGDDLVISDRIVFSNISYALRNTQNNLFMPYKNNSPITNHFQITSSFDENHKNNFFLIGDLNSVSYLSKRHRGHLVKSFVVPFSSTNLKLYEISFK